MSAMEEALRRHHAPAISKLHLRGRFTTNTLRYGRNPMADLSRAIPDICRELDHMPSNTLTTTYTPTAL